MKKILVLTILIILTVFTFSGCFLLNRYMKSDQELAEHYNGKLVQPEFKNLTYKGHNLHYAVISKSDTLPLLVMVHGAPGAWYGYMNLTDDSLLQHNFRIVAVDRIGYGKSDYGKEELSVEVQARAIRSVIEKENITGKKVHLLGRSYGAPIAAWLAIDDPDTYEKLVMVSPVIDPEKEKFYWFSELGRTQLVQWMLPEMLNVATREKFSHQREMRRMLSEWDKLSTPTYVLVGEDDDVADTANYSFAKRHLTECPAVFMKLRNTGHQITRQQPDLVKNVLLSQPYQEQLTNVISEEAHRGDIFCSSSFEDDMRAEIPKNRIHRGITAEREEPAIQ
jgi:pimeloyl-ACP methyl ester carboxylesterase